MNALLEHTLIPFIFILCKNPARTCLLFNIKPVYRKDPKFSDGYARANSADPDQTAPTAQIRLLLQEQSDRGLYCLLFHLHYLEVSFSLNFRVFTVKVARKFRNLTV